MRRAVNRLMSVYQLYQSIYTSLCFNTINYRFLVPINFSWSILLVEKNLYLSSCFVSIVIDSKGKDMNSLQLDDKPYLTWH